jgi:hypothetical protein
MSVAMSTYGNPSYFNLPPRRMPIPDYIGGCFGEVMENLRRQFGYVGGFAAGLKPTWLQFEPPELLPPTEN